MTGSQQAGNSLNDLEVVVSRDGSHTLFSNRFQEHYHSLFGAVQESQHIFMEAGLRTLAGVMNVRILEVGFGTGLNALLSLAECRSRRISIEYTGIEKFPVPPELWQKFNYHEFLQGTVNQQDYLDICHANWNEAIEINPGFLLRKLNISIQESSLENETYDVVFFDAFSPEIQAEMWTEAVFHKIYQCLKPGGILVTYSSKGIVKQALRNAGFQVKRLPGPPGKREMLRACKEA